jgi:L,D-transpeptidase ErfK/SrfK
MDSLNFIQCPAGSVPYTIRDGDTLGNIAFLYNTTVQDIVSANPGINEKLLQIGQQICVPLKPQMYPACPTTNYYVVTEGDTFDSIADYFGINPQMLLYSNYGIDPDDLYVDQILCIPVAPPPASVYIDVGQRRLVVYRNDSVYRTYEISIESPNIAVPRGNFKVINKQLDLGVEQGARWIGLSYPGFGIQGRNTPQFIENVSEGRSIMMSNRDASEFFNLVTVGTSVSVV